MLRKPLIIAGAIFTTPALAHHPLGGLPMETFGHGVLSGLGHPVLGFDHLFFVALVGIVACLTTKRLLAPLAYIATMLAGCLFVSVGGTVPAAGVFVALSLLTLGGLVLAGKSPGLLPAIALFALFGLFHGAAFGESIANQEAGVSLAVLIGYLLGLGVVQYLVAFGAGWLVTNAYRPAAAVTLNTRFAGAMVAGVGAFLTLEQLEGPLLQLVAG